MVLSKNEKREHTFKVLREWPSATEQLRLGHLSNSVHGIHLGGKLWNDQQDSALNLYKRIVQNPEQFWKRYGGMGRMI